jgi:hypothetical protein
MQATCNHLYTVSYGMAPHTVQLLPVQMELTRDGIKKALYGRCECGNTFTYDPHCLLDETQLIQYHSTSLPDRVLVPITK